jgi:hypothetical protein
MFLATTVHFIGPESLEGLDHSISIIRLASIYILINCTIWVIIVSNWTDTYRSCHLVVHFVVFGVKGLIG